MDKTHNKIIYILMAIFFIIGISSGYIIGFKQNKKCDTKEETKKESKKEDETNKDNPRDTTVDAKFDALEELTEPFIDEIVNKKIYMNGKEVVLSSIDKNGTEHSFKVNDNTIWEWSPNPPHNYRYSIIKGSDNRDYLLLIFEFHNDFAFIVDDNGNKLFNMSSEADDIGCSLFFDGVRSIYVRDGIVYYYKYRAGSKTKTEKVYADLMKLDINNNEVNEEKQEIEIALGYGECS